MTGVSFRVPLILCGSEGDALDRAIEIAIMLGCLVREGEAHLVIIFPVLVDEQDRPLAVRPFDCICGEQGVSGVVEQIVGDTT